MSAPKIPELPADRARQADAMFRACEYQILQTVSAWLDLREDKVIDVEGAEDFDTLGLENSETTQVKTSPQPISLAQKGVQDALNNFWKLREAASGRKIRYRYLTIAPFTTELGSPFGPNVAGMALWRRQTLPDAEIRQLALFLSREERLLPEFREWLKSASPEIVREQLVDRVSWEVRADDVEFVERTIYSKLAVFAERRGSIPASLTKKVANRLTQEVWAILRKPAPRRLDFFLLEEIWEDETRESIPRAALEAMLARSAPPPPSHESNTLWQVGIPPLPGTVAARSVLVRSLREKLLANQLLNLHGSTGMGKTTLAKLIVEPDRASWYWWRASSKLPEQVRAALNTLIRDAVRDPSLASIVLDDLDFSPAVTREMEDSLGELVSLIRGRSGKVIITSQKPLPNRIQSAFGVNVEQAIAVPKMTKDEVDEFAVALGCTDSASRKLWSLMIHATNAGHPQLTGARLFALRRLGWPECNSKTFAAGMNDVAEQQADARQLLAELPESQRELLQRLSIFPTMFTRTHAIEFGASPPPIPLPGDVFDPLVGPWIEPLHAGYFALSPLLENCAKDARADSEFRSLQNAAAFVLLKAEPHTAREAANAFFLLWQTKNVVLGELAANLMSATPDIFNWIAADLWWFTLEAADKGTRLFPSIPHLSLLLRVFQFRVAKIASPTLRQSLWDAWRWEVENSAPEYRDEHHMLLVGEAIPDNRLLLPTSYIAGLFRKIEESEVFPGKFSLLESVKRGGNRAFNHLPEWVDTVSSLAYIVSWRCTNIQFLDEFLTELEAEGAPMRSRILRGFVGGGIEARMAIDRVWLAEADGPNPDWTRCVSILERTFSLALKWEVPALAEAAMRGISVVLDEYVKDHQAAHAALDGMSQRGGFQKYSLNDRRACIFFSEGSYDSAEKYWRLALEAWPRSLASFDTAAAFAARSAGVAAARLERWEGAAKWFLEVISRLPNADETAFRAGAFADAGYCLWKAGKKIDAISSLIKSWELAETLPLGRENLRAFTTRKMIGHVIVWLYSVVTADQDFDWSEPIAGACSSPETPEKMRELPETENANVWIFLIRLERELNAGRSAAELGSTSIHSTVNPSTRPMALQEKIHESLAAGTVADLPKILVELTHSIHYAASKSTDPSADFARRLIPSVFQESDGHLGCSVFLAGLLVESAKRKCWNEVLSEWRASLPQNCTDASWERWFSRIATVSTATMPELIELLRGSGGNWSGSMLGALRIISNLDADPDVLFYAHARWLHEIRTSPWLKATAPTFCDFVAAAWHRVISTPALLLAPRINIPSIQTALAGTGSGEAKAAKILLAVAPAVRLRIEPVMARLFRKLAASENP